MTAIAPIYWEGRAEGCQCPGLTPAGSPAVAVALQRLRTFLPNLQGHWGSHRRSGFGFHVLVTPPTSTAPLGGQQGCPLVVCSNSGAQR